MGISMAYDRARRRQHLARMKAKARRVLPWDDYAGRRANHLAVCSCPSCGNPRRYWGAATMQELRAADAAEVALREVE